MTKLRRAGYVFVTWKGDHAPKHVHVYRNEKFIAKWDLENHKLMRGKISKFLVKTIKHLQKEELL